MSIILGVDPGSKYTGYGLISVDPQGKLLHIDHGVIDLHSVREFTHRLLDLGEALRKVLEHFQPHFVAVEEVFLGRNVDSAFRLGHARGVILYESIRFGVPVKEYATRSVKKGLTGSGAAQKEDVQMALRFLLGLPSFESLDASDALAIAVYHAQKNQQERILRMGREL